MVQKIEVLDEQTPNTPNGVGTPNSELEAYPLTKVIQKAGKTMEPGKNLLEESKKADGDLYFSDGEDYEGSADAESVQRELDGYDTGRMTFEDAVTDSLTKLAAKNRENKRLRVDAIMAIGGNLD